MKHSLELERERLGKIETQAEHYISEAKPGTLRVARKGNTNQFYWRTDAKDTLGNYLKKNEMDVVKELAQKEYYKKLLPVVRKQKKRLEAYMEEYQPEALTSVYDNMTKTRQNLVEPFELSIEDFVRAWEAEQHEKKAEHLPRNICNEIYTERGDAVRSKSEKILADKFLMLQIPYEYEVPLYLQGYGYIHPDYIILNKRTRTTYYWEHLGMMDNSDYCQKTIKKIELYEKNGIYPGEKLILTYETSTYPFNVKNLELLIDKYLL